MEKIPVAKPFLGEEEVIAASRAIRSGWITQGPEVESFEKEFANFVGAPHAVAVSNCTVALQLALEVCGITADDEVITVSHSFIATANAVRHLSAIPVFVDIEADTLNMDPTNIERAISKKTKAILCVHQLGRPCDLKSILDIAKKHKLYVIEDAACAIGSEIKWNGSWQKIGAPHGDLACFSMHPRKLLSTGDGGMITTKNPEFDRHLRLLRQHGMSVNDRVRHQSTSIIFEEYETVGYNFRLTDIQAAVGREQLKKIPEMVERRREQVNTYIELLSGTGLEVINDKSDTRCNWQSFWVRLSSKEEQFSVMTALLDQGISSRRGVMCAHNEKAYANKHIWRAGSDLNISEEATDCCLILPVYHEMTLDQQKHVIKHLTNAVQKFRSKK